MSTLYHNQTPKSKIKLIKQEGEHTFSEAQQGRMNAYCVNFLKSLMLMVTEQGGVNRGKLNMRQ